MAEIAVGLQSVEKAHIWLNEMADELGTDDRQEAYRVLRAYLHALRDRLPVNEAAQLAAQLPELIRGIYYEGWNPSKTPVRYRGLARPRRRGRQPGRRDRGLLRRQLGGEDSATACLLGRDRRRSRDPPRRSESHRQLKRRCPVLIAAPSANSRARSTRFTSVIERMPTPPSPAVTIARPTR